MTILKKIDRVFDVIMTVLGYFVGILWIIVIVGGISTLLVGAIIGLVKIWIAIL